MTTTLPAALIVDIPPVTAPIIVLVDGPALPVAGDPCNYCGLALRNGRMVVSARCGYCDAVCVDLALHLCTDCGGDVRTPTSPGLPGCSHRAGWVR